MWVRPEKQSASYLYAQARSCMCVYIYIYNMYIYIYPWLLTQGLRTPSPPPWPYTWFPGAHWAQVLTHLAHWNKVPGSFGTTCGTFSWIPGIQTPTTQEIPVSRFSKSTNVTFWDFKNPTYHRNSQHVIFRNFENSMSQNPDVQIGHSDNPNRAFWSQGESRPPEGRPEDSSIYIYMGASKSEWFHTCFSYRVPWLAECHTV